MQLKAELYSSVPNHADVAKHGFREVFNGISAGVH